MASKTLEEVAEYMKKMHFRKGLFGIQPASMWKKLEDLDSEYRSVFYAQELSYEARLKERDEKIAELEKRLSLMKNRCTFFYIPSYIDGRLDLCHVFYHLWDFTGEKR
mgnify:CR=1 FL=1